MTGLRVDVLGPVRASVGAREVALGPARRRALFALLAVNSDRFVSRDELLHGLWDGTPPESAAGNIYTYVSGLRRALGRCGAALISGPTGYRLRLDADALDLTRFERLYEWATQSADAGDGAGAVRWLDEALALWRGSPYANLTGPYVDLDRERLGQLRLAMLVRRADLILDAGGADGLVADLTALVQAHPLHEPLRELLVRALHRAGRGVEALAAFHAARSTLREELGVEPGPALRRLYRSVLNGPRARPGPPVAGHPARPVFVGRVAEVALLRRLVDDAVAGRGAAVWIEGDPGIGKSELLAVAGRDAATRCRVTLGTADEFSRWNGVRWHPAPPADPRADEPQVVLLDGLQWAAEETLLGWERLVRQAGHLPLLLVAATRPDPNHHHLARLRHAVQRNDGHLLALSPLPTRDIERIIGAPLGALPAAAVRVLAVRAGGNPLYARELAADALRRGAVPVVDGRAGAGRYDAAPPALLTAVRAGLDVLGEDTLGVLRFAALLDARFTAGAVGAVAGLPAVTVLAHLHEAMAANVVVDRGPQYTFRHPFLRQALRCGVPAALQPMLRRYAERSNRSAVGLALPG
ncbi:hypothetical protein Val02_72300 [Virgisporangium aliadipatigenens]|uniref:OmpR/PhoB-type domain-containing protein n=1 Tax=Virgisporangium aliadipatigenens TaxID=741659 RepID=A0A8J3YR70_9ACTN|nr:BTAD domain-containing putative transcriptional regulator [Virgisporangium aliadipatigenens]GIJ50344.1 hypothetical protein Val02_72300 [Virgisporangium aliadipatigenens]